MSFSIFALPLLAGYLFLICCHNYRYEILRASGYHVFLKSGIAGLALFVLSYLQVRMLSLYSLDYIWTFFNLNEISATCFLSMLTGVWSALIFNLFRDKDSSIRKSAHENGAFTEILLRDAMRNVDLVSITTKSRKYYVGFVFETGLESKGGEGDLSLIPVASGYREEDSLNLNLNLNYISVYRDVYKDEINSFVENELKIEETELIEFLSMLVEPYFRVAVPKTEVASVRYFDYDIYDRFHSDDLK